VKRNGLAMRPLLNEIANGNILAVRTLSSNECWLS